MRLDLTTQITQNPNYIAYLREFPSWHLELNRYPEHYATFIENYKVERKITFPDKIEKISLLLTMMEMMI